MSTMSDTRHTPVDRATLAASVTARAVADRASELVIDVDSLMPAEARLVLAAAVERDAITLRDRVVLRELIAGATFEMVADAIGQDLDWVRAVYAPALDLYRARLATEAAPS